ncbi:MAG: carbohydrate ABC transporter permease [Fibrobacteres bacterium]|nr:carbohydrate ABC transporter permease [Fibrobacterota bacterium]
MPIIPEIGRKHIRVRLLLIGITVFLWLGVVMHLFPVWWMVATSLKTTAEIYANPIGFIPQEISFASYKLLFGSLTGSKTGMATSLFKYPMTLYVKNSLILALGVLAVQIPSTLLLAYTTSRLHTNRVKQAIFYMCVATMMIPAQVKMVPSFLLLSHFPWPTDYIPMIPFTSIQFPSFSFIGSFWGVILPVTFNSYNFLLLKNFFDSIDKEYIEAARIDGCSEISIITQIMLPLARPIIAFTCYVAFVNSWNNFMGPWIILQNDQEKWPLAVIVFQLQQYLVNSGAQQATSEASEALRASGAGYNALMALALIECIPVMLLFMFFREQIMKGVKMKGLKA